MRIAVTGASGFLGGHIVEHLLNLGHDLVPILRQSSQDQRLTHLKGNLEVVRGELDDSAFLSHALSGVDVVIHSAARVREEGSRQDFIHENVELTQSLLRAAELAGVRRFVFISSPSAVAELTDQNNIDESYPYPSQALNYYCESKAIAEQWVLSQNRESFVTCALRPRCIWGPADQAGPYKRLLEKLYKGKMLDLSGGKSVRSSMCYVGNATHACALAIQSNHVGGRTYFITDGEPVETWAYLDRVAEYFGLQKTKPVKHPLILNGLIKLIDLIWAIPVVRKRFAPPVSSYAIGLLTFSATFSTQAAERDMGYRPIYSIEDGMKIYADWIEANGGVQAYLGHSR